MSYCRWSTDNFKCDIYAYQSDNGYEIHVAANRYVGEPPKVDYSLITKKDYTEEDKQEYLRQEKIRRDWMDKAERKNIELPYAGESFTCPDLETFLEQMIELKTVGYNFPDGVLETIKEEMQPAE